MILVLIIMRIALDRIEDKIAHSEEILIRAL